MPGTYMNGFYELRPLPYAEAGYGNPESGQTVVNATNGKLIRLLVEDEPFDIRYGELRSHERVLDLRAGVLRRTAEWLSPTGRAIRVSSTRFVSFTQRAVAAILYEVEPLDDHMPVVIQSELVANESMPDQENDPRAAAALASPLRSERHDTADTRGILTHRTAASDLIMSAAFGHVIDGPEGVTWSSESFEDIARLTVTADLSPGRPLRLTKFLAYGWSAQRSVSAVSDQVGAAVAEGLHRGWDRLLAEQRSYLDDFWERADVEIDGDAELQQAVRFALFHCLQAGARAEQRAIPAKGLTGPGYDGHAFWDTEAYVLPLLSYTAPNAAADALRWRHSTLDLARDRARQLGLEGAAFPWRTPCVLGHRGVRAPAAELHGSHGCRRCAPMEARDTRFGSGARAPARARRGGVSLAHDPGAGVLRLLARGDRRLSHQCGHRRCRHPPLPGHRRRGVRARGGRGAVGGDREAVALARTPRRGRALSHRRRDRSRRIQRHSRQQRLHEPDGAAQPGRGGGGRQALSRGRRQIGRGRRRGGGVARRRQGDGHPLRRGARDPSPGRGLPRARSLGLRAHRSRAVPAAAALPLLRPLSQAGREAGRSGDGDVLRAPTPSPTSRRSATSPTTRP